MTLLVPTRTVTKRMLLGTARHELGHAYVARLMGRYIHHVVIRRDGSGTAMIQTGRSPTQDLRIALAGYITERLLAGQVPCYLKMCRDPTQRDDVDDIMAILLDRRLKPSVAMPAAFAWVVNEVSKPEAMEKLRRMSKTLVRTRVLYGRTFNTTP
jgi:hypothetical protein